MKQEKEVKIFTVPFVKIEKTLWNEYGIQCKENNLLLLAEAARIFTAAIEREIEK